MKNPILVSSTDGVSTKLLVANMLNKHDIVGIDLVAMCVDDVIVVRAEPLFFLDYITCGKLYNEKHYELAKGITRGKYIRKLPSQYLKEFYYDTVNFDLKALELALDFAGADHLVAGSDYPHRIGSLEKMVESIEKLGISY